jgi:hypothetical protein
MSLATGREKRANAGSKMTKLINEEEEEDDFYKTAYGGFEEVARRLKKYLDKNRIKKKFQT